MLLATQVLNQADNVHMSSGFGSEGPARKVLASWSLLCDEVEIKCGTFVPSFIIFFKVIAYFQHRVPLN